MLQHAIQFSSPSQTREPSERRPFPPSLRSYAVIASQSQLSARVHVLTALRFRLPFHAMLSFAISSFRTTCVHPGGQMSVHSRLACTSFCPAVSRSRSRWRSVPGSAFAFLRGSLRISFASIPFIDSLEFRGNQNQFPRELPRLAVLPFTLAPL